MDETETKIARTIERLGAASEVELQAETLRPLGELRQDLLKLEKSGLVQRRSVKAKSAFGDRFQLTPDGLRSLKRGR